jgi:hypothetical protein
MVSLISKDVEAACSRSLPGNEHDCSGFVRAVAANLMVFLPGASGNASSQVDFMRFVREVPALFRDLGSGSAVEDVAVEQARLGNFVVCGLTADELNRESSRKAQKKVVNNGHVAVVAPATGSGGWPLAWWGQLGGSPGRRQTLSKCFRAGDRSSIHYFVYVL